MACALPQQARVCTTRGVAQDVDHALASFSVGHLLLPILWRSCDMVPVARSAARRHADNARRRRKEKEVTMIPPLSGLHHVTAIASDPQRNVDLYTGLLGLRLVKVTVDVDDPEAYHLYYGDEVGRPGTLLTFYCWPGAIRGRPGTGQTVVTALAVPPGTLVAWRRRLIAHGLLAEGPAPRGAGQVLSALVRLSIRHPNRNLCFPFRWIWLGTGVGEV